MEAETIYGRAGIAKPYRRISIPVLSLIAGVLIIAAGLTAILTPGFYCFETLNWQAQSLGQDFINVILIAPLLILSSFLVYRNSNLIPLWSGTLLYLIYTFAIYCFDVKFNSLFIIYCIILGLCFYSIMYFIYLSFKENKRNNLPHKVTALYLIVISVLFYILWLSELVPAVISGTAPKTLTDAGLPTNPVHAIDLSVALPGIFLSGLFLLRKSRIGYITAPAVLVFCILMDITIGFLTLYMKHRGIESDITITYIIAVLAVISVILFIPFIKRNERI